MQSQSCVKELRIEPWRESIVNGLAQRGMGLKVAQTIENAGYKHARGCKQEYETNLRNSIVLVENATNRDDSTPFTFLIPVQHSLEKEVVFTWFAVIPNAGMSSFLLGSDSYVRLEEQESIHIEYQYRAGNYCFNLWLNMFQNKVEIDLLNFTIDKRFSIVRKLQSFGNTIELPYFWNTLQTHMFVSYSLTVEHPIYQKIYADFAKYLGGNTIITMKLLQNLKNYLNFFHHSKGELTMLYLGPGVTTRKIALGNFEIEAKQMQVSKESTAPVGTIDRLSEDIRIADEDAYHCKNGPPRKQILLCLCSLGRVKNGEMTDFCPVASSENHDSIRYPLGLRNSGSSTSAYVMDSNRVYPAFFIEYNSTTQ